MSDKTYAIVETGSKQFRVSLGTRLTVEKLAAEPGSEVVLDRVLMVKGETDLRVGNPHVKGARVVAQVLRQGRGPKVLVFKKRSKKTYKKIMGHRQAETQLVVKEIQLQG